MLILGSVQNIADRQVDKQNSAAIQITDASDGLNDLHEGLYNHFADNLDAYVDVRVALLKEFVTEDGFNGPASFKDGKVVSYRDGVIEMLDPTGDYPLLYEDYFGYEGEDDLGISGSAMINGQYESVILRIGELGNDYYYVDWTTYDELIAYLIYNSSDETLLAKLESIYDVYAFRIVETGTENTVDDPVRYYSYVSEEFVDNVPEISVFDKSIVDRTHHLTVNGVEYLAAYSECDDGMSTVYIIAPYDEVVSMSVRWRTLFDVLCMIVVAAVCLWVAFIEKEAEDYVLDDKKKDLYKPSRVKVQVAIFGVLGAFFLFSTMSFVQVMNSLYEETKNGQQVLEVLCSSLEDEDELKNINTAEEVEWYESYGDIITDFVENYPEVITREKLAEIAESLNVEYLILFDENKEEVTSSARYIDYKIVDDRDSQNYEANKVFNGVPYVYYQVEEDELSGKKVNIYVTAAEKNNGKYGAILFAQDPEILDSFVGYAREDDKLSAMCKDEDLLMIADAADGTIKRASDVNYLGQDIRKYGVDLYSDSKMDYFTIDRKIFYGLNRTWKDEICYYFVSGNTIRGSSFEYSFKCALCFLACYVLAARIMLKDYTDGYFTKIANKGINGDEEISYEEDEKKKSRSRKKLSRIETFLAALSPSQKKIGITAGASTPDWIIREVYQKCQM